MEGCANATGGPVCFCATVGFELQPDGISCAGKRFVPGASRDICQTVRTINFIQVVALASLASATLGMAYARFTRSCHMGMVV